MDEKTGREVKFRAWDKTVNRMFNVDKLGFGIGAVSEILIIGTGEPFMVLNDDLIIMQFTGLKDKNGVEIFEGDIFHLGDKSILYVVEWIDAGLKGRQLGNKSSVGFEYWANKIQVIGNRYSNPDLLGGTK